MEKTIENKKDQFYEMLLKAPSAIGMLKGANHVFEMANPLYLHLTGKKDVIGKTVAEVLPEVVEQGFISMLDYVYKTGESYSGKEKLVKVDREGNGKLVDLYIDFVYQAYRNSEGIIEGVFFFINDLTEQVVQKKKIEKSEKQYRRIVETAQEGIWLLDENSRTTFVNKKMCEILEYTEAEMMGETNFFFMEGEAQKEALIALERRKRGVAENLEYKFISKNGKHVLTKISANPIFDDMGNFKGSLGMVSDITEKKHLEELLEKSNRLARIGSWEIDVLNGTVFWSDITKEIREAEPDFIPDLSTGIGFFTEGINKKIISQRVQECMDKGIPWDEELQFTTFKGNLKWIRTIGEAVFIKGKCSKIYGSFQDITERKNAVEKVLRSEAKLKIAQLIAHVGSWEVTILNDEHSWSDEFYRVLGINESVIPSRDAFLQSVHPDDREMVINVTEEKFSQSKDSSFHFRFIRENGELGYASSEWKYEFDSLGNPIYIYGILRDLTKEKKAEIERLKMISDLVQRNKDLEQFSYIISHNLRSPVANIIGITEELKDETHSAEIKLMLGEALSSDANRLENVIADLNTILQTKTEITERKERVILSELAHNIELSISDLIHKEEVTITTDFTEVDNFSTIKSYMQSIFYNLISNSIKYRQPTVNPKIEISSHINKNKLFLIFKDNGSGIDMERKGDQIFGLYKRFHSDTEGKGMGLYMVKTQVETLGGKISVNSEVNKGTVFTIEFEYGEQ
ncbi:PAS domain S-box protein [Aequorivita sp. CIP111184]|uniref:PAS domain-containing sensor histidine kinase n=1 Tax=Aequorivita sp. CIP111184 TaxID=2211356 RepID=UPI000DBBC1AA|nr:PAS domain S-box protein [Aequorivita sp. CIP111184]SRX54719.1 Histidine protein kinase SaeS [Aequorivita sp. CIP111184]